jgi:hypothetical protein
VGGVFQAEADLTAIELDSNRIAQGRLVNQTDFLVGQQAHGHQARNTIVTAIEILYAEETAFFDLIEPHGEIRE